MKISFHNTLIVFVYFFAAVSCNKKELTIPLIISNSNNANAMVITGYGYSNATIFFNTANSSGYYDTALHKTFVNLVEDTDSLHFQVHFHFNGNTYFAAQDTIPGPDNVSDTILITNKNNQKTTVYRPTYANDFLTINTYDNAGGHINGVFSGSFINSSNLKDTLKVSNGRFSILRLPDVY